MSGSARTSVFVFDPFGLSGEPSSRWSPLRATDTFDGALETANRLASAAELVAATAAVSEYVRAIVERTFAQADADAPATAIWALVHGLAFLHLDGKLDTTNQAAVPDRVTAAIHALLSATNIGPGVAGRQ